MTICFHHFMRFYKQNNNKLIDESKSNCRLVNDENKCCSCNDTQCLFFDSPILLLYLSQINSNLAVIYALQNI